MTLNLVRTRVWRDGQCVGKDFPLADVSERLQDEGALVWVDLCDPDHECLTELAAELSLDPNAIEDAVARGERPKATRYAGHAFVTAYATWFDAEDAVTLGVLDSRLRLSRVSAFVLSNGIVTVRRDDRFDMSEVVKRWEDDPALLTRGSGALALLHGLLDVIVDGQFETIETIDDAIEALEEGLFDESARTREVQRSTYRLRKELVQLRRVVLPMREVVGAIMRGRAESEHEQSPILDGLYTDLYDHVTRAAEWTDSLRDMVVTVFETNLSLQDARLNTVMKKLTGWAAIIAVPTAVTGWFGQNVLFPGVGQVSGTIVSTVVIVTSASLLYILFRRRDWI
ncbi:magnesium transporter CorA family protein [Rhodococcus sp. NPDC056960]|uniref:magnesium transporter CorA family protein n=1 Tax=Rhodococcus sp. NPDC056960 TaxID=3345982 RepID=UPI003638E59D